MDVESDKKDKEEKDSHYQRTFFTRVHHLLQSLGDSILAAHVAEVTSIISN
jgi:hypothetical protein